MFGALSAAVGLVIVGSLFVYFYISVNRLEKKVTVIQAATVEDSGKIAAIVNFFNTNLNAQANQK